MDKHNSDTSTHTPSRQPRSKIEELVSLSHLADKTGKSDCFINKGPVVCPPWARGAYGGHIMAQALLAAYETVLADFTVHSIHCHFLNAVNIHTPVVYHVKRVRDARSFVTRIIEATQGDKLMFCATASFTRGLPTPKHKMLQHAVPMPRGEQPPEDTGDSIRPLVQSAAGQAGSDQPCDCIRVSNGNDIYASPSHKRFRQWVRARGRISDLPLKPFEHEHQRLYKGESLGNALESVENKQKDTHHDNHHAHAAALAYMSDNYFLAAAFRAHNASRFSNPKSRNPASSTAAGPNAQAPEAARQAYFDALDREEQDDNLGAPNNDKMVGMVTTMDHTIFFHNLRHFRADEWMLVEMNSPWAGDERGLVTERIWSHDGTLIATCTQEGLIRLTQTWNLSNL